MLVVHVYIHVKLECIDAFKAATLLNARASIQEAGIARFDFCQQADDPAHFILVEAYRSPAAQAAHRETTHYASWRDAVYLMMAEPRASKKWVNLFPEDSRW